jgi:thymidylate synthase ThyX
LRNDKTEVKTVKYTGNVYCATVSTGALVVRKDGTVHVSGNCQLMTHRQFSRNSSSSRAIPVKKMIGLVEERPAEPLHWGKNQKGMQSYEELTGWKLFMAKRNWNKAKRAAIRSARVFDKLGAHKQYANRVLEPFMNITTIVTATDYDNFFHLRTGDSQPEIRLLALEMYDSYCTSLPKFLKPGEWHTPYVSMDNEDSPLYVIPEYKAKFKEISSARCARVSYRQQNGKRDFDKDIDLYERLVNGGHWSPLEHVAVAEDHSLYIANFRGFKQYRKFFDNECNKEFNGYG